MSATQLYFVDQPTLPLFLPFPKPFCLPTLLTPCHRHTTATVSANQRGARLPNDATVCSAVPAAAPGHRRQRSSRPAGERERLTQSGIEKIIIPVCYACLSSLWLRCCAVGARWSSTAAPPTRRPIGRCGDGTPLAFVYLLRLFMHDQSARVVRSARFILGVRLVLGLTLDVVKANGVQIAVDDCH